MPEVAVSVTDAALAATAATSKVLDATSKLQSKSAECGELTNFKKVCEFHQSFGVKHTENPQIDIFDKDPKTMKLRLDLIREEFKELEQAAGEKNMTEVLDALSDILYVTYGAGSSLGLDLDKAFALVHDSNMSKLCKTQEEAEATIEWYKANKTGPEGKYPYDSPAWRKSGDYFVVYNESSGKVLKSINYKPVSFKSMLPN
ncbi:unnamed protein product [Amoebophrya sp. A25]|nr:unnamed protein product [Amoebophrya sp. A25]|eukprot:GSA25T00013730001.1